MTDGYEAIYRTMLARRASREPRPSSGATGPAESVERTRSSEAAAGLEPVVADLTPVLGGATS